MNRLARGAWLHGAQRERLTGADGLPQLPLGIARAAANDSARKVAVVAGARVAGEDIQDDQRMRAQRPAASLVWIARLLAAGDDGVARRAAGPEDGGVDLGAQNFRCELAPAPAQLAAIDLGGGEHLDAAPHPSLRDGERAANGAKLFRALRLALRPE